MEHQEQLATRVVISTLTSTQIQFMVPCIYYFDYHCQSCLQIGSLLIDSILKHIFASTVSEYKIDFLNTNRKTCCFKWFYPYSTPYGQNHYDRIEHYHSSNVYSNWLSNDNSDIKIERDIRIECNSAPNRNVKRKRKK